MRNTICFLVCFLFAAPAYCQVAVQFDKQNIAYLGVGNPLTVGGKNCPSGSIVITTDNGTIIGEDGHYLLSPAHLGYGMITVKRKTGDSLKVIGGSPFRVKSFPAQISLCSRNEGWRIPRNIICRSRGPQVWMESMDAKFFNDSFTLFVIRADKMIFYRDFHKDIHGHRGAEFDEETKTFFEKLRGDDKLYIAHLAFIGLENNLRSLPPAEFTIASDKYIENGADSVKAKVSLEEYTSGNIPQKTICRMIGPHAHAVNNRSEQFIVDSFTVIVKRGDAIIFSKTLHDHYPIGTQFDEETINFFKTTHENDKLIITNIIGYSWYNNDGSKMHFDPIEFTITPANYVEGEPDIDPITGQEIFKLK